MILDRYVHPAPAEGWPRWMDRNLDEAKFVLMVCTETYRRRVLDEEEPGKGLGVRWEGKLIYNRIYHDPQRPAVHPDPAPRLGARAHPQPGSGAYLLPDRDVRPHRPGLRGPVPPLDRSAGHAPARPWPDQILPPIPRPHAVPGPLPPSGGPMTNNTVSVTPSWLRSVANWTFGVSCVALAAAYWVGSWGCAYWNKRFNQIAGNIWPFVSIGVFGVGCMAEALRAFIIIYPGVLWIGFGRFGSEAMQLLMPNPSQRPDDEPLSSAVVRGFRVFFSVWGIALILACPIPRVQRPACII